MKLRNKFVTSELTANFVLMTKEVVDALLSLNTKNRNLRAAVVKDFTRILLGDMWRPTNQGIGVSASGFLVDGQHRLEALKAAGYPPVLMLIVTGLSDDAVAAVDIGTSRNARDYLGLLFDTKVSAFVSAVLRTSMSAADNFNAARYQPAEYALHYEAIALSLVEVLKVERVNTLPAAVVAALVDAHHKGYEAEVVAFTAALITGEMLEKHNPALLLRNWIAANKGHGGANALTERYKKTTRALQAWVDQKPLGKLYRTRQPISAPAKK